MKITVLTIFPESFDSFLKGPVIHRAVQKGIAEISIADIRAYADGSYRHIDDSPFGGGAGMIMRCAPVLSCLHALSSEDSHVIAFTPKGKQYSQKRAHELSHMKDIILLCGHYEGMDERIYEEADEMISMGDYVLTGGELPAMSVIDSIVRLLPGAIRSASTKEESFEDGLLEYPQYTKPAVYEGRSVPDILLSGDHEKIRIWRLKESLRATMLHRPDLLENRSFTEEEQKLMREIKEEELQHAD